MKKSSETKGRVQHTAPDRLSGPTVRELIDTMSAEDAKLLTDILSGHKTARIVSTLETKAVLEKLVKGEG